MSRGAARPRRRGSGQARRPRTPLRGRLRGRLPSRGRVVAVLLFAGLVGGLVTLANGPWLRVRSVTHGGERFTAAEAVDRLLAEYAGAALMTLDTGALEARVRKLPAVATARVRAELPDRLRLTIAEKAPAMTWLTIRSRLVVAADGSVIAALDREAEVPPDLAALPTVDDQRPRSRELRPGSLVPSDEIAAAERLRTLEPALLGSTASGPFGIVVDEEHGFILVSAEPAWRVAFGLYGLDPDEPEATAAARLEAQVAAVRTLFATQPEVSVSWVDARNPGKVYWAP